MFLAFFKKENEGMIFSGSVVIIMFLTFSILFMTYSPNFALTKEIVNYENFIENDVRYRNNLERIYSKIYENISINNEFTFNDVDSKFVIEEKKNEKIEEIINLKILGEKVEEIIDISNKTDININILDEEPINEYDTWDYMVEVFHDGKLIKSVENKGLRINADLIYDEDTGEFNYGEYRIVITPYNAILDVEIKHEKIKDRIIEVSNDNMKYVFEMNNEKEKEVFYVKGINND